MGKRKSKKRTNKLARPPRRKAGATGPKWEIPELPPEFYARSEDDGEVEFARAQSASGAYDSGNTGGHDYGSSAATKLREPDALDAPIVSSFTPPGECPFGAVELPVFGSISYQKFHAEVSAIRAALPETLEQFAVYDLAELKQRRWLTRYCIKKETGELSNWQQVILENAGYNWVRGRKPSVAREKKASRVNEREVAWTQAYEALRDVCAQAPNPTMAMVALLRCDDVHYTWLRKQVVAIRSGKLKSALRERLQALPFDLDAVLADRGFTVWRSRFKAYAAGDSKNTARWTALQRRAKQAGELLPWRIEVLDALDFDWSIDLFAHNTGGAARMEDRWRAKLDQYLALEAVHGQPLSMQLAEARPLRPWLSRMREHYKKGNLRPELIAEFEAKGFVFLGADWRQELLDRNWNQQFEKLEKFKQRFGHVRVPSTYQEDVELGKWVARQRERLTKGALKGEHLARFKAIGVEPAGKRSQRKAAKVHISVWLKVFQQIETILVSEHGGQMPASGHFSTKHRSWLKRQRDRMRSGELEPWQIKKLASIGFDADSLPELPSKVHRRVDRKVHWQDRLERLRRFVKENGHGRVARSCPDRKLFAFVQRVRLRHRNHDLSPEELRDLNAAGFSFDPSKEVSPAWLRQYEALKVYRKVHGDSQVPRVYPSAQGLSEFVAQQKQRGRKGQLMAEHIRLLDALDFQWSGGPPVAKDG